MTVLTTGGTAPPEQDLRPHGQDPERRVEQWLVGHLDDLDPARPRDVGESPLAALAWSRRLGVSVRTSAPKAVGSGPAEWSRIQVRRVGRATIVRLQDKSLLRDEELIGCGDELCSLVRAGQVRLVVSFAAVERMSSRIVAALVALRRRCVEAGGDLRLSGLRAELAELLAVAGLRSALPHFPDESAALERPWPNAGPTPLPVAVLAAMVRRGGPAATVAEAEEIGDAGDLSPTIESEAPEEEPSVRLEFLSGKLRGRSIEVRATPYVIGRDPDCTLRVIAETISRRHLAIERSGSRVLVRDLGSTNGSSHNGRPLRGDPVELADGDELVIGPLRLSVRLGAAGAAPNVREDLVARWLGDDGEIVELTSPGEDDEATRLDLEVAAGALKIEQIEGVAVASPRAHRLEDEAEIAPLREALVELAKSPSHRRQVLNLVRVGSLSSRAIGMIVAHAIRLDRLGGRLRLALPSAPVLVMLEGLRVPMIVPIMPTLDEAVLASWD